MIKSVKLIGTFSFKESLLVVDQELTMNTLERRGKC